MPGPGLPTLEISCEISKSVTNDGFKEWQIKAFSAFDSLAEKLLADLDVIVSAAATNESLSFDEKLTLLANYVGHGQPLRAFPFLDQNQYRKWLEGIDEPRKEMQAAIIQLCQAEIASAFHEGSSFDRVLSYLPSAPMLQSPVLHGVTADSNKLLFDPWQEIDYESLSSRVTNCLKNKKLTYVGQLTLHTEQQLLMIDQFGRVSINEVKEYLSSIGARLGMRHPELDRFNEELAVKKEAGEL